MAKGQPPCEFLMLFKWLRYSRGLAERLERLVIINERRINVLLISFWQWCRYIKAVICSVIYTVFFLIRSETLIDVLVRTNERIRALYLIYRLFDVSVAGERSHFLCYWYYKGPKFITTYGSVGLDLVHLMTPNLYNLIFLVSMSGCCCVNGVFACARTMDTTSYDER